MKRSQSVGAEPPARRPLKIFATDPMLGRTAGNRITIEVKNEPLKPGPMGARVQVIDYDGTNRRYYAPVDLDDAALLMQNGLEPSESDPRFHQQMVYAVAMKTIENFDRALGRRITFRGRPLRIFPHAFHGENAYYDRALHAVLFGFFRASETDPGENLPGQLVYTCLSHDIIAHEVTHALVDRLRRYFLEPSNHDVLAFHEGFSDIVALFQHFSFRELLRDQIQRTRTDLRERTPLVELARQFGFATGAGQALRSALDKPEKTLYQRVTEAHDRGAILVAAVFDCFFTTYQRRIRDLIRIATGGSGIIPVGDLHPDLINMAASEAGRTAQGILTMAIRAFEYLPPVDITFGDYLRALVTADYELVPDDEIGQRAAMIEAFRLRGIYPQNVISLAEESLLWPAAEDMPPLPDNLVSQVMAEDARPFGRRRYAPTDTAAQANEAADEMDEEKLMSPGIAAALREYASNNALLLKLDPKRKINVQGFHSVFRVAPDGQLLIELVAQFTQEDRSRLDDFGGIPLRGGTTVVAAADGSIRYVIAKPLPARQLSAEDNAYAEARIERQRAYVTLCDAQDPKLAWSDPDEYLPKRMAARMSFAGLHAGMIG